MNAKVTPESSTRSVIEISISAAEVAETRAAVAKEYAAQAELPGFRPGKAPVALVERKFGARIGAAAAERAISQIDTMKKSILARAFRGELGTNDPNDEPAIELLKRTLETRA